MTFIDVSVIVPIYNADKFLPRCLKSLVNQNYTNYEVILVDDGSCDLSEEICKNFCSENSNFRYYRKNNSGVSDTRNFGIEKSKGEILLFVDADDYVSENYISSLVNGKTKNNCEFAIGLYSLNIDFMKNDNEVLNGMKSIVKSEEMIRKLLSCKNNIYGFVWRCAFDKKIIDLNKIKFRSGLKMSEDYLFILDYLRHINSVYISKNRIYTYCLNDTSATSRYISTLKDDMEYVNDIIYREILDERRDRGFQACLVNTYLQILQNSCKSGNPFRDNKERIIYLKQAKKNYIKVLWSIPAIFHLRIKVVLAKTLFQLGLERIYVYFYKIRLNHKYRH